MTLLRMPDRVVIQAYTCLPYVKQVKADETAQRINRLVYALKDRKRMLIDGIWRPAADVFAELVHQAVAPWFAGAVLLPVPGSKASPVDRSSENTVLFAQALAARFGDCSVGTQLVRTSTVATSHQGPSDQRPNVAAHEASMGLLAGIPRNKAVVLVDDVLTRGTTAIAATQVLRAAGYTAPIRLVCGAHTRFPDQAAETAVEWEVAWSVGSDAPIKVRVKSHNPTPS